MKRGRTKYHPLRMASFPKTLSGGGKIADVLGAPQHDAAELGVRVNQHFGAALDPDGGDAVVGAATVVEFRVGQVDQLLAGLEHDGSAAKIRMFVENDARRFPLFPPVARNQQ